MFLNLSKYFRVIGNGCLRCSDYKIPVQHVQCRQFKLQHAVFKDDDTSNMSKQSFWEDFYVSKAQLQTPGGHYDWFFPYEVAKPWLHHYIEQQAIRTRDQDGSGDGSLQLQQHAKDRDGQCSLKVIDLGCGTSDLSTRLFVDNPMLQIKCVDFSKEAIMKMQNAFGHLEPHEANSPGITFVQGDALCLPFEDQIFDICYEKGTVDAILKQKTHGTSKAVDVICEIARVLKLSGVLLQFSDEPPELRLPLLEKAKVELGTAQNKSVSISFKEISDFSGIEFFLYVMQDSRKVK